MRNALSFLALQVVAVATATSVSMDVNADKGVDSGPEAAQRPNFIFFFPDTLRAESFNSYGSSVPGVTPNFDAFADREERI